MIWDDMILVGRIARPHGLRGQVAVNPETDFVDERFRQGAELWVLRDGEPWKLTVASCRLHSGRPIVAFEGFERIEDVEPLASRELRIPEASLQPLEAGQWYEHQLVGCNVETIGGSRLGPVVRVEGGAGISRLVIEGHRGEIQVPLVHGICAEIDVQARRIRVDPPEGLIELNERSRQ